MAHHHYHHYHHYISSFSLDSVVYGGLPRMVREEAVGIGYTEGLLGLVEVTDARASRVCTARSLLSSEDLLDIQTLQESITSTEHNSILENNPQNATHYLKVATFMNNPPEFHLVTQVPQVVGKMLAFAMQAWEEEQWSGVEGKPGPLREVSGGVSSLSIRYLSTCLPVCLSACCSVCLSVCLFVCLVIYVGLSMCLAAPPASVL